MRHGEKTLLLVDASINIFLGMVLLSYSGPVIRFFGLPETQNYFYPNILGAVLFGIGIALVIAYLGRERFSGLGLGGAIAINLSGGIVLFLWLVTGKVTAPLHGKIILWSLDLILLAVSLSEIITSLKKDRHGNPR